MTSGETLQETRSAEETFELAKRLASAHPDCSHYYLEGELGAGKTVWTKGLAAFFGVDPRVVVSPTFALVHRYSGGRRVLYHLDLYRIEDERELEELGIEEMEEEGAILVVEWAEKLGRYRRSDAMEVVLETMGENTRRITVRKAGSV